MPLYDFCWEYDNKIFGLEYDLKKELNNKINKKIQFVPNLESLYDSLTTRLRWLQC